MAAEPLVDMPDELADIRRRLAGALAAGAASAPAASVPADADLAPCGAEVWLTTALAAYEQARTDGLCSEGAWECAVAAAQCPGRSGKQYPVTTWASHLQPDPVRDAEALRQHPASCPAVHDTAAPPAGPCVLYSSVSSLIEPTPVCMLMSRVTGAVP